MNKGEVKKSALLTGLDIIFHPLEHAIEACGYFGTMVGVGGIIFLLAKYNDLNASLGPVVLQKDFDNLVKIAGVGLGLITIAKIWRATRNIERIADRLEDLEKEK